MSLLIDALKQAEAARAQAADAPPPNNGLQLEPLPPIETASTPNPAAPRERAPRSTRPPAAPSPSDAARGLFEVKQQSPSRFPLIVASIAVIALVAGSVYVWWAMQPHSNLVGSALNNPASIPAPPTVAPTPEITPAATPVAQTANNKPVAPVRSLFPTTRREPHVATTPEQEDNDALRIRRTQSADAGNESSSPLQTAYAALQEGKLALATQRYQEVLRQDPRNGDALNALGFIAWRNGQPDLAERMFRSALQANPQDATAISQLAMLYASADPAQAEARLRSLAASQPNSSAAHYALGELMTRQGRWSEAQQSLFQAYTFDSDNPDILFNLAVSLDHLNQAKLAKQFYERAISASAHRPASFDRKLADSRSRALGGP